MWKSARNFAYFAIPTNIFKVTILGARGGIGRHLALLLKQNKNISDLSLYDTQPTDALREDLSHIDTKAKVKGYTGPEQLADALRCCNLLVIVAGQARAPSSSNREDMFVTNAGLMVTFMKALVSVCPKEMPFIHIVTNPVNTLVPLCSEVLKNLGRFHPQLMSGSSSLDSMRARTFLGEIVGFDPSKLKVPVVGGHSAASITPLVSQRIPKMRLEDADEQKLIKRIIYGANEVFEAKQSQGTAQLSIAYTVSKFCDSVLRAYQGEKDVTDVAFIPATVNELEYFSCQFTLDQGGIKECLRLPSMSEFEQDLYHKACADIEKNVERAKKYLEKDTKEEEVRCEKGKKIKENLMKI